MAMTNSARPEADTHKQRAQAAETPPTRTPDPASCEERLDEAVEETFPASDPPAASPGADIVQPADEEPPHR
jgi:hypothetical protein